MIKTYRINDYKKAKELLDYYMKDKSGYAFIHYACQSFYETQEGNSPRIVAICIMYAGNHQIYLFSLASLAEQQSLDLSHCDEKTLDMLERQMLSEFYMFMKNQKHIRYWFHWNMKDQNYGFEAIEQRYRRLNSNKKTKFHMDSEKLINISSLLHMRYGENFVSHPRLWSLLQKNSIHPKNLLNGEQEADAYKSKKFSSIDRSVQAKVQVFSEILDRAANQELLTDTKLLRDIYGISIGSILTYVKENWFFGMINIMFGVISSIIASIIYSAITKK